MHYKYIAEEYKAEGFMNIYKDDGYNNDFHKSSKKCYRQILANIK